MCGFIKKYFSPLNATAYFRIDDDAHIYRKQFKAAYRFVNHEPMFEMIQYYNLLQCWRDLKTHTVTGFWDRNKLSIAHLRMQDVAKRYGSHIFDFKIENTGQRTNLLEEFDKELRLSG